VAAGVLGWFLGEFQLIDASWLLTTHRWLGTATLASAVLLLGLSEWRRRPEGHNRRIWFRAALFVVTGLVLATGFFGGAVVYGLDHYTWQQ
jgi:heme A synthase